MKFIETHYLVIFVTLFACKDLKFVPMNDKIKRTISMVTGRCPSCHEGKLFRKSVFSFSEPTKMNEKCPVCSTDFKREPGFYFGAAYVSYALTVALWVAVFVAMYSFNAWGILEFQFTENPMKLMVAGILVLLILLLPIYRVSRSIWLGLFSDRKKA